MMKFALSVRTSCCVLPATFESWELLIQHTEWWTTDAIVGDDMSGRNGNGFCFTSVSWSFFLLKIYSINPHRHQWELCCRVYCEDECFQSSRRISWKSSLLLTACSRLDAHKTSLFFFIFWSCSPFLLVFRLNALLQMSASGGVSYWNICSVIDFQRFSMWFGESYLKTRLHAFFSPQMMRWWFFLSFIFLYSSSTWENRARLFRLIETIFFPYSSYSFVNGTQQRQLK